MATAAIAIATMKVAPRAGLRDRQKDEQQQHTGRDAEPGYTLIPGIRAALYQT
jgi:hypothetical protein